MQLDDLSGPKKTVGPITDILQWVQCFAALAAVLSKTYLTMVPEFMAYWPPLQSVHVISKEFCGLNMTGPTDVRWHKQRTYGGQG